MTDQIQTIRDQQASAILDGLDELVVVGRPLILIRHHETGQIIARLVDTSGEQAMRGTSARDALAQVIQSTA